MFMELFNPNGKSLGKKFVCHGCLCQSKIMKTDKLPKRWSSKEELRYQSNGSYRARRGCSINYYCESCTLAGINAAHVAIFSKRELNIKKSQQDES